MSNSTESNSVDKPLTLEVLKEAQELIKALTPKEAPADTLMVTGDTGLRIIKNVMLPENTIVVSKRLFDIIYESSTQREAEKVLESKEN